ncbi:MAG: DUF4198 domain-containing protein [Bacteroidales bacterium]|nr:DUF4198 domain-containing protein [Bacteroidales bacterium]
MKNKQLLTQSFVLLFILFLCSGHDLFIRMNSYYLKPHSTSTLRLFNGTFSQSENIITRNRMDDVVITGPSFLKHPDTTQWYDSGNETILSFNTGKSGTYVAGISTKPRTIYLNASDFNEYLEHDGVLDILKKRKAGNQMDKPVNEKYAKHVKTIFQVGESRTHNYLHKLGFPLEFIPLQNPYELKPGDFLDVKLLSEGKPLSGKNVYAHSATYKEVVEQHLITNNEGIIRVKINCAGEWYLRTIHMIKTGEKNIDYLSSWSTLTFSIR